MQSIATTTARANHSGKPPHEPTIEKTRSKLQSIKSQFQSSQITTLIYRITRTYTKLQIEAPPNRSMPHHIAAAPPLNKSTIADLRGSERERERERELIKIKIKITMNSTLTLIVQMLLLCNEVLSLMWGGFYFIC